MKLEDNKRQTLILDTLLTMETRSVKRKKKKREEEEEAIVEEIIKVD